MPYSRISPVSAAGRFPIAGHGPEPASRQLQLQVIRAGTFGCGAGREAWGHEKHRCSCLAVVQAMPSRHDFAMHDAAGGGGVPLARDRVAVLYVLAL